MKCRITRGSLQVKRKWCKLPNKEIKSNLGSTVYPDRDPFQAFNVRLSILPDGDFNTRALSLNTRAL